MGLEWILGRLAGGVQSGFTWLKIETGGFRECGDEPLGSGATWLVGLLMRLSLVSASG
jgi:hypothetical protein